MNSAIQSFPNPLSFTQLIMTWLRLRRQLRSSMRPVRVVGLYLLFVFLGGALLAPWIYKFFQLLASWMPAMQGAASKPFPRFVNRALLILALIGLRPFLRAVNLSSWRAVGLPQRGDGITQAGWGFGIGLTSLACIVALALTSGARELVHEHRVWTILGQLLKAALVALLVGTMEEIVFRGALFGALRKSLHWSLALALSSLIYAVLHFLERPSASGLVTWSSGLGVLAGMAQGLGDWNRIIPGLINLIVIGAILALAYQRTGSLYFSIGLHAGWIFWLKAYGLMTDETATPRSWLFGSNKLVDGWLAFVLLAGTLAILSRVLVQEDVRTTWKERQLLS